MARTKHTARYSTVGGIAPRTMAQRENSFEKGKKKPTIKELEKKNAHPTVYDNQLVKDLKVMLKNRGLPVSGTKPVLIGRLVDDDNKKKSHGFQELAPVYVAKIEKEKKRTSNKKKKETKKKEKESMNFSYILTSQKEEENGRNEETKIIATYSTEDFAVQEFKSTLKAIENVTHKPFFKKKEGDDGNGLTFLEYVNADSWIWRIQRVPNDTKKIEIDWPKIYWFNTF